MKKIIVFIFIILIYLTSCNRDTTPIPPASDYIIFGEFHGESIGPRYSNIYKVVDGQIFIDTTNKYPSLNVPYEGKWIKLPNAMMDFFNDSINNIPSELKSLKIHIIGEPDSHDQGGLYLEIFQNKNYQHEQLFWMIDKDLNNVPVYLHEYLRTIESVIDSLKKNS